MATTDFDWARIPLQGGEPMFLNTDASNDFIYGTTVQTDTTNVLSGSQTGPGAIIGSANVFPLGVAVEKCAHTGAAPYNSFRVQTHGLMQVLASAAISAGAILATAASGKVATQTAGQNQLGQALTAAASGTDLLVAALHFAKNA